jgi:predicted N-formylglutamate amidohydrolase
MNDSFRLIGQPRFGGILVVADHASNRVPEDIDLGIGPVLLNDHVALDIGVREVAERMAEHPGVAAYLGNVSRLVCDFNRQEDHPSLIPVASDGHSIPGNMGDVRDSRVGRFFRPYHNGLSRLLEEVPQALILSLHSFTPRLSSRPEEQRPWDCGVLYNRQEGASRVAIRLLREEGLNVGDQQPYSGKLLNATMDRHAEADGRPYFGLEIRQDRITTRDQQDEWAKRLIRICNQVAVECEG